MITTIIVITSVILAAAYAIAWLAKPGFRQRVEQPKHLFAAQVRQYDEGTQETNNVSGADSSDA